MLHQFCQIPYTLSYTVVENEDHGCFFQSFNPQKHETVTSSFSSLFSSSNYHEISLCLSLRWATHNSFVHRTSESGVSVGTRNQLIGCHFQRNQRPSTTPLPSGSFKGVSQALEAENVAGAFDMVMATTCAQIFVSTMICTEFYATDRYCNRTSWFGGKPQRTDR